MLGFVLQVEEYSEFLGFWIAPVLMLEAPEYG